MCSKCIRGIYLNIPNYYYVHEILVNITVGDEETEVYGEKGHT